jgi:type IV fimbrial biogenesis protein FimT
MQRKSFNTTFAPRACRQRGLTLIESLVAVAITSVATGVALPGFQQALQKRHLDGAAAQLHTDMQLARSLAVAQNRTLRISFKTGSYGSCYVVHSGSANDCSCDASGVPACSNGAHALRSVNFEATGAVQLRSNVASMVLDPTKGTVSPTGTLQVVGRDNRAVHLVVNVMGRARLCTPSAGLQGYAAC